MIREIVTLTHTVILLPPVPWGTVEPQHSGISTTAQGFVWGELCCEPYFSLPPPTFGSGAGYSWSFEQDVGYLLSKNCRASVSYTFS